MANEENNKIYLVRGNDTPLSVCVRKGGASPVPYDLSAAERVRLALVGHGTHVFAVGTGISGEDNNIVSGVIPGRSLLPGDYDLELTFVLDGRDKRFAVEDMFEAVNFLAEDADGTAEGEGDGISITVTVQPEVIEIAGPTGPQGHDGKSAYEVWLEDGHTGTEDDFFKWLASEGLPWNDVDISSLTVRNGYITSSGVWNSGSTYCHTLLPVSAGKAVRVTAAESNLFRYAWLTSGQAPRGGIAADLVPGTERTDVAAGSSVTLDVPEGAKYLYIYLGTPADKANTPESLAVSDTIPSLRKDIDSTGADVSDIDDRIGYPGVYGALEGAGTAIVYARQVHVVGGQSYRVNMLHPDVTVTSPTGNAYRFVVSARNGEGAELSKLVQVVDTAALKDYYDITAPDGTSYLLIYGRCSSGETCDFTVDPLTTRTYNDGDILTLNPDSEFQPKWQSASKPYYTSQNTNRPNCVRFLHLSDVHGNWANVRRFLKFYNHWVDNGYDITAINTGDTATDYLTDGVTGYTGIAGADKILGVIGNHDTRGAQGWQQYKGLEVYNALFAPLISGWGVVQPEGAAENGYCYYHKDYASNKLRLVVVDIMGYDDTEDAWLASVLASAKTAGYHVLIATHFAGGRSSAEASQPPYKKIDCQWSTMAGLASDSTQLNGYNSESYKMADTVHAFMEDGGIFCGYMCGHSHLEFIARLDKYPDQMIYTIGSSKSGKVHDYTHTAGTRMQDEFEIVAVDTDSKFVKLYKVGANYDRRGRLKDSICVSYDTHEVVGFPVTVEALSKEMDGKQEKLVSGQNIKTLNGESILGNGNIQIEESVQSDWDEDDSTDPAYIKNKPTIPTNVVKYTSQSLTDAQKAQARTNIGATVPEIFFATYGETTAAEVDAAVAAGKVVVCYYNSRLYPLVDYNPSNDIHFNNVYNIYTYFLILKRTSGNWSNGSSQVQSIAARVDTIVGNETSTSKYTSAKAVADALGKWGVVSQTITWSGSGANPRTYAISNIVHGLIPQSNIDLYEASGAVFNETSGYFELNEITDIAYDEMKSIYAHSIGAVPFTKYRDSQFALYQERTTLLLSIAAGYSFSANHMFQSGNIVVANLTGATNMGGATNMFAYCNRLRKVIGIMTSTTWTNTPWHSCYSLESVIIKGLKADMSFNNSSLLTLDSVVYIVTNAANTSAITITLHADAYARCVADTTEYTLSGQTYTGIIAYAAAKNITIASA